MAEVSAAQGFRQGLVATLPLVLGALPFGMIFGTLAPSSGLSAAGAVAMSALVFAGSSQFLALGLLATQTPWWLILVTTGIVNLRHLLYGAALVPYVRGIQPGWKLLLAFGLTDETFVIAIRRYEFNQGSPLWYHLGSMVTMYGGWQASTWVGVTVGQRLPHAAAWGLDFAMVATFISLVIPYLVTRPMLAAVLVAGVGSWTARGLPYQLGLLVAAGLGILTGIALEGQWTKPSSRQ